MYVFTGKIAAGTTSTSSLYGTSSLDYATDGDPNTELHTKCTTNQWFKFTFKDICTVQKIILINGKLANGAVVSSHVSAIPFAGSGYRMEIYGTEGTLVASGEDSPQLSDITLEGAQKSNLLAPILVADHYNIAASGTPHGEPYNVGQIYARFATAINGGSNLQPDFDTAVELHHLIDAIKCSSKKRQQVSLINQAA